MHLKTNRLKIHAKVDKGDRLLEGSTPFLKWAGGKRWLVQNHVKLFPKDFNVYIEPFLGSAAVFFFINPDKSILSDINEDLILTYKWIRKAPLLLQQQLQRHHTNHCSEYYYRIRGSIPNTGIEKAARFIYLNRTCWNGLYRVNTKGIFNVPIGTKTTVLHDADNFSATAKMLKGAEIKYQDFELAIDKANRNDFVFVDPPYTVAHNNNGFIKYNQKLFSWDDQIRLRDALDRANKRGVKFLLLNANHYSIENLYSKYVTKSLTRMSVLAGKIDKRKQIEEMAIKNYE